MKRQRNFPLILIPLILLVMGLPAQSHAKSWSEARFDRAILKIHRDMDRKRWDAVIVRGQKTVAKCNSLHSEQSVVCITLLRNINQSYEKTRRFNPNPDQIEKAYRFASQALGKTHFTTRTARDYYYKYLIFTENYAAAIPLVLEIIELEELGANDDFQLTQRYNQLYALQGLVENWPAEEAALTVVLSLAKEVMGEDSEDVHAAAEALAYNYCIQKKYHQFFELINKHSLQVSCFADAGS